MVVSNTIPLFAFHPGGWRASQNFFFGWLDRLSVIPDNTRSLVAEDIRAIDARQGNQVARNRSLRQSHFAATA